MSLSLLQYNIFSLALLLPVILNLFIWQNPLVSTVFGGVFFLFQCFVLGPIIAPNRSFFRQSLWGGLATLALLLLTSTAVYMVGNLTLPAQALAWLLHLLVLNAWFFVSKGFRQTRLELHHWHSDMFSVSRPTLAIIISYTLLILAAFTILISAQTSAALRSPWEVIPPLFWVIFFCATVLAWILLWFCKIREASLIIVSVHLFLCFSLAIIVYKLGYGYDSFIHQVSEQIISSTGILLPKTPYYLGQYSLIVSLHRLLGIGIHWLDLFLVPLLAAVSLPVFAAEIVPTSGNGEKQGLRYSAWLAFIVILLPFSSFIVTTPQGLANLFFLWLLFGSFALLSGDSTSWRLPFLLVIATCALLTHPLTGIPSFILLAGVALSLIKPKWKIFWWQWLVFSAVAVPLMLWLWSLHAQTVVRIKPFDGLAVLGLFRHLVDPIFGSFMPAFPTQFAYTAMAWWAPTLIVIALFIASWLLARLHTTYIRVYLVVSGLLFTNAILVAGFFSFPGIAAYESSVYASRLITLALWSLCPFALIALLWLCRQCLRSPASLAATVVIIALTYVNAGSLYASYPRQNRFERSRQFSTSAADFQAVQHINSLQKSDYVVLANQSVSAAAIASFGFQTYFPPPSGDTPIFYYPVPTSSPLYSIYLQMVNEAPTREVANLAHRLTGAQTVYFVLNAYWDNADTLRRRAAMEADEAIDIANGTITIFTYRFPAS